MGLRTGAECQTPRASLDLVGQCAQGGAEALGLGFIPMHDRILKQRT